MTKFLLNCITISSIIDCLIKSLDGFISNESQLAIKIVENNEKNK